MSLHLLSGDKLVEVQSPPEPVTLPSTLPKEPTADNKLPKHTFVDNKNEVLMRLTISNKHYLYWFCPMKLKFKQIVAMGQKIGYRNLRWGNRILDQYNKGLVRSSSFSFLNIIHVIPILEVL